MAEVQPKYAKLVKHVRNGLEEQVHYGIILHINKSGIINKIGDDNGYRFYHRSCMKPLQITPVFDLKLDEKYNFTEKEIAVCAASHTGDLIHQEQIRSILNKIKLNENDFHCLPHEPISKTEQKRLILNGLEPTKIHNNCSGKHSAMLAICKEMGFDIKNYTDLSHPLTDLVLNKVMDFCEVTKEEVVISKDGCGLPVIATTLEALAKGFLNLFTNKKYLKLRNSILNNPYIAGGNYRLDSEIMNSSDNLIAKVGACGLCVVVNIEKKEAVIIKIADSNMDARAFALISYLLKIKWSDSQRVKTDQINNIYLGELKTQTGEILGNISACMG